MGCSASCRCTYFPIAPRSVRAAAMHGLSLWCGRRWAPSRRAARLWDHARLGLPLNALAQSYCPAAPPTIAVIGASRAYRPAVARPVEAGPPRVVVVADTAAVTGRSMAVALHGSHRLSTPAFRPGLSATSLAGAEPLRGCSQAGSVPMHQALHAVPDLASHQPVSIASHDGTCCGLL